MSTYAEESKVSTKDWSSSINQTTYGGKPIKPGDPLNPSYYKDMAITPTDFIVANNIRWREGNVIKYICRWRNKNGVEDLRKARVYIDQLIKAAENE